ncbi:MAG: hypothetical protein E5W49_17075 [Mesorhizobium sp.]|nr:MAG: hypothetical protein E5W49_17075 [Mesorhizobium sp.]
MRKVVVSLFAILAGTSVAIADDAGCAAFKWPVTREEALFAAVDTISFTVPPERVPAAGTFGATASVAVPPEGELQISLSDEAWVDVVQDGKAVKSAAFSRMKTCPGIRKSVRFKLAAGPATVQFSGAKKETLKVAVLTPE